MAVVADAVQAVTLDALHLLQGATGPANNASRMGIRGHDVCGNGQSDRFGGQNLPGGAGRTQRWAPRSPAWLRATEISQSPSTCHCEHHAMPRAPQHPGRQLVRAGDVSAAGVSFWRVAALNCVKMNGTQGHGQSGYDELHVKHARSLAASLAPTKSGPFICSPPRVSSPSVPRALTLSYGCS